jgi:hypothetical protein
MGRFTIFIKRQIQQGMKAAFELGGFCLFCAFVQALCDEMQFAFSALSRQDAFTRKSDGPVFFPSLKMVDSKPEGLMPPQTVRQEEYSISSVSLPSYVV